MTEKLLTSPLLPPLHLLPPQTLGMGSKFNLFPEQHQHKPTTKTFVPGQHARIQDFFVRWGRGPGPQLILQCTEGVNGFITHFLFSRGGGGPIANFYKNPYNYNLRFSRGGGGAGTSIPPLDPHMDNVAFWHE